MCNSFHTHLQMQLYFSVNALSNYVIFVLGHLKILIKYQIYGNKFERKAHSQYNSCWELYPEEGGGGGQRKEKEGGEGVEKRWVFESGAELEGLENEEYIGIRVIVVGIEYYCEKREGD